MGLKQLLFGRMIERRLAAYQNELMEKHCEEVRHIYQTMRGWRHDFHNHIQALLALSGEEEKTREYLLYLNDESYPCGFYSENGERHGGRDPQFQVVPHPREKD